MNKPVRRPSGALVATCVALVLMALTAVFLSRLQGALRLGRPGVRLIARPVVDELGAVVGTNAVDLPTDLAGYHGTNLPLDRVTLDWLPKDTTFGRVFYEGTNGLVAVVNAVLMGADRTSIHKPEYCLTGQGFSVDQQVQTTVAIREPVAYDLPVIKMVTTREVKQPDGKVDRRRALYVYWFVADGQVTADHNMRMLSMAWDLVSTGVLQRWAYISCLAECEPGGEDELFARLSEFIAEAVPQFQLATGTPMKLARDR